MKVSALARWLDTELEVSKFDDVSNNGIQISRKTDDGVSCVAFAVDASVVAIENAAKAGAQMLVVHHGISWGGGIKRIVSNDYAVVSAAIENNIALYGVHLPLDASKKYGNNWSIAHFLKLVRVRPAFSYHGNIIGVVGEASQSVKTALGSSSLNIKKGERVGICSGGAGEFAVEAKELGCKHFITGEANWADIIASQNADASLIACGHYETETFGVKALTRAFEKNFRVNAVFVDSRKKKQ